LAACLKTGDDPAKLLTYLAGLGQTVASLDDLLNINRLDDEDELGAFKVTEGVAVSIASHGAWVLFQP
jgi:hypothetical protein